METRNEPISPELIETLDKIQQRVLWLATLMIHHANQGRPNSDDVKVGGHQASSASVVSIMTALYFDFLRSGDRVSIKPHASPVFHAIQYLLDQLPLEYLTMFRSYGGLQAYPSRTKDPDTVDFSTGSVGLGAVAPAFGALAHRYALSHFGQVNSRRFVGLIGDAELDEGNVWEAILEQTLTGLDNLLWIVDLNRQSLDRVVPGIRAGQLERLFEESGWRVLEAKYGRVLQGLFNQPGGTALNRRIDEMNNEEYQALIRLPGDELRSRLISVDGVDDPDVASVIQHIPDEELPTVLSNLGGHDLEELLTLLRQVNDEDDERPTIIFAYTVKGWGTPIAGHPLNHSMFLTEEQIDALRVTLGVPDDDDWSRFTLDSAAGKLCNEVAARLFPESKPSVEKLSPDSVPEVLSTPTKGALSTQQAFGRLLMSLSRLPKLADRIVTTSPDVSVSTNLSGWILKTGVYAPEELPDYDTDANQLRSWRYGPYGQHIELGISEMNFFHAPWYARTVDRTLRATSDSDWYSLRPLCVSRSRRTDLCPILWRKVYICWHSIRNHAGAGGGCASVDCNAFTMRRDSRAQRIRALFCSGIRMDIAGRGTPMLRPRCWKIDLSQALYQTNRSTTVCSSLGTLRRGGIAASSVSRWLSIGRLAQRRFHSFERTSPPYRYNRRDDTRSY